MSSSAQRPITYHLVRAPEAVRAWSPTSSQVPGGVLAAQDGTSSVAGNPMVLSSLVQRVYSQVLAVPPNGS